MADEPPPLPVYHVPYLRLFPWLRLFHCPGAAADPKSLMLAVLGMILLHAGWMSLDGAFPGSGGLLPQVIVPWEPVGNQGWRAVVWRLAEPAWLITAPYRVAFDPSTDAWKFSHAALGALWTVVVWGLIGGAIARVAVVRLARGER